MTLHRTPERSAHLLALRLAGKRECEKCHGEFTLGAEHFYADSKSGAGGYMYVCKKCHSRRTNQGRRF